MHGCVDLLLPAICRYRDALDAALATKRPDAVASVLEELAARGGLGAALGNRDAESLAPLLAYVTRWVTLSATNPGLNCEGINLRACCKGTYGDVVAVRVEDMNVTVCKQAYIHAHLTVYRLSTLQLFAIITKMQVHLRPAAHAVVVWRGASLAGRICTRCAQLASCGCAAGEVARACGC